MPRGFFFLGPLQKEMESHSQQKRAWLQLEISENQLNIIFSFDKNKQKIDNRERDIFCPVPGQKNKERSRGRAS